MLYAAILLLCITVGDAGTTLLPASPLPTVYTAGNPDVCQIWKNMTKEEICDYVDDRDDICEGGGYLLWSQYVECEFNSGKKIALIVAGFLWMLALFVLVSTTADEFFSPSVASIVAHLKISESIAGVTFMAFGNGAPDIFGSIASVLSSPKPKAGLALGELFGSGIFVTTMVTATIILVKPFHIDVFSTLRDIVFYLIAIGWILFVFLHATQVYIWEPAGYLALYAVYLLTVVIGHYVHKRKRKRPRESIIRNKFSNFTSRQGSVHPAVPEINIISDAVEKINSEDMGDVSKRKELMKRVSIAYNGDPLNFFSATAVARAASMLEERENESEEQSEEEFVVSHHHVYTGHEARSRAASLVPPPIKDVSLKTCMYDIYKHLHPLPNDWDDQGILGKVFSVIKMPVLFVLKLTIPLNETSWSKSVAIIQAIFAPQWFLFALQPEVRVCTRTRSYSLQSSWRCW